MRRGGDSTLLMHLQNWSLYKNCIEAATPNAKAKLHKLTTPGDDAACQTTGSGTDVTTSHAKAKLEISTTCDDDNACKNMEWWLSAVTPDAGVEILKERNPRLTLARRYQWTSGMSSPLAFSISLFQEVSVSSDWAIRLIYFGYYLLSS